MQIVKEFSRVGGESFFFMAYLEYSSMMARQVSESSLNSESLGWWLSTKLLEDSMVSG